MRLSAKLFKTLRVTFQNLVYHTDDSPDPFWYLMLLKSGIFDSVMNWIMIIGVNANRCNWVLNWVPSDLFSNHFLDSDRTWRTSSFFKSMGFLTRIWTLSDLSTNIESLVFSPVTYRTGDIFAYILAEKWEFWLYQLSKDIWGDGHCSIRYIYKINDPLLSRMASHFLVLSDCYDIVSRCLPMFTIRY